MSINASSNSQEPKLVAGVLPAGTIQGLNMDASGNLLTAPGSGIAADVNIAKVNGVASPVGHGVAATALRVELPTDGTGLVNAAQSGAWSVSATQIPATSGGASLAKVLSAASTNATSTKASAGQLYSYNFFNANAAIRYVHFYNKVSAPTVGTDVPVFTVGIPIGGSVAWHDLNGTPFALGIAFSITTGAGDTDTVAVGANDVTGFFTYK